MVGKNQSIRYECKILRDYLNTCWPVLLTCVKAVRDHMDAVLSQKGNWKCKKLAAIMFPQIPEGLH